MGRGKPGDFRRRKRGTRNQRGKVFRIRPYPRNEARSRAINIAKIQSQRSARARALDAKLKAQLAMTPEEWANQPNRRDLPNVDYPGGRKKKPQKRVKRLPKKQKLKAQKRVKMSGVEKMHLSAMTKQFMIDPYEIDSTLTYSENKRHLKDLAKQKGYSEGEISGAETEKAEWVSQQEQYFSQLRGELESAGYKVTMP